MATFTFYYKKSKITKQNVLINSEITKNHLQYELQKVEKFHLQHLDFISYYQSEQTHFDEILFLAFCQHSKIHIFFKRQNFYYKKRIKNTKPLLIML